MTSTAVDTAEEPAGAPARRRAAESLTRAGLPPEALLLALVVVLQAVLTAWFAAKSSWVADDFVIFQDADDGDWTLDFLGSEAIAHFSPGHRAVTLGIHRYATFDFASALAFLLVVQAAGVVLVQRIVRWFAGPVWWSYALAFAYGASIVFLGSLQWFAAGLLVLPPATLTLAAIHAYLIFRSTGRREWLAWSVVAFAGALLFYEKAVFVPVYLVGIRVLFLDGGRPLGENVRAAVREWRVWAPYAVVAVAWFVLFRTRPYADTWKAGNLGEQLEFLRIGWFESYVPALLGIRIDGTESDLLRIALVLVAQLVLVVAVVLTVRRRRAAWRVWLFLAIAFVLNSALLFPRVAAWYPELIGHILRYQTEMVVLTPLVLAAAIGRPRQPSGVSRRSAVLAAAAVLAFTAATIVSADAITDDAPGADSKQYLANLEGDVDRLQSDGAPFVVLLDGYLPGHILPGFIREDGARLSANLPLFLDNLLFDQPADTTYRVQPDGHLEEVRFERHVGGDPAKLYRAGELTAVGRKPEVSSQGLCLTAGTAFPSLELLPPRVLRGRPWYLRVEYRTNRRGGVTLDVNRGVPYPKRADLGLPEAPLTAERLVALGALPGSTPTFGGLRLGIAPQTWACFTRLEVGSFARVGPVTGG